jgi:hypothetical protein
MQCFGRKTVVALALLWAWPLSVALAQTSPPTTTQIEVIDTGEHEVEFADVLFTQKPMQDNEVEFEYRFERQREKGDAGDTISHAHELTVGFGYRVTDWLGVSFEIPYSITDVKSTPDGDGTGVTRNIGDVAGQVLFTFWKDPERQFAAGGGLEVTFPTGSYKDGTGEGWALAPFLSVGKHFGPVQILGQLGYEAKLKRPGEGEEREQALFYNVALAYPLFEKRLIPFFELNGVYTFSGEPNLKHKGQLYLSPGIRINPFGDVHGHEGHGHAHGHGNGGHPWYERLSLAVGAQFPVTAAKEYEWALTTSLKMEF